MKNPFVSCLFLASCLAVASRSQAASIAFQFTGGSLAPVLTNAPAGVTATDMVIGGTLDLSGGTDALRFESGDTQSATGTAIADENYISFSVTIAAGTVINLTSLTADYNSTLTTASYSNSRVYSSIDSFNEVTGDTIGIIGKQSPDASAGTNTISFTDPTLNSMRGANVTAADFTNLTNRTITFYFPWVDNGGGSYYTDLDNLTVNFDVVPEPSSLLLGAIGLLPFLRRTRKVQ